MKPVHALSFLALALTIVPPVLFVAGSLGEGPMKLTMLVGAVLWFLTAPRWLHGGES
jgi:hypothetical protein